MLFRSIVQRDAQQGEGSAVIGLGFHFWAQVSFGGGEIAPLQSRQRFTNRRSIVGRKSDRHRQPQEAISKNAIHRSATAYSTPKSQLPSMQIRQTPSDVLAIRRNSRYPPPLRDVESGFLRHRYLLKIISLLALVNSYGRT